MPKQILDVGNCVPDHSAITQFLTSKFDCEISQTHGPEDTLSMLKAREFDLVLINRKLDRDYTDGAEILKQIKADATIADVPVMIITNFNEHQEAAVELGAMRGFGKLEFEKSETLEKLKPILG
ncbi:response regulator [Adhaeretor mobilis]|uniref:Chemotaxis regulatory protein CheY n=1 Tax=Adhaeretor mobilis TaxID=1930276 RepID=A0A517MQI3_9BACT|nr:response regulator [Adhaeretor mobilis]QDS97145.1 chemotaxis regulatory protein CheY [Adhaeretor mobilis]